MLLVLGVVGRSSDAGGMECEELSGDFSIQATIDFTDRLPGLFGVSARRDEDTSRSRLEEKLLGSPLV